MFWIRPLDPWNSNFDLTCHLFVVFTTEQCLVLLILDPNDHADVGYKLFFSLSLKQKFPLQKQDSGLGKPHMDSILFEFSFVNALP